MQLNFKKRLWTIAFVLTGACALTVPQNALAGSWGALVGYNNPAGSRLGLNFLYQDSTWGFELGAGGLATVSDSDNDSSAVVWGDLDLKYFFASSLWRPYFEGGMGYSVAAGGAGNGVALGSPFVGLGLLYAGKTLLFTVAGDYKINSSTFYPSAGIGFRL